MLINKQSINQLINHLLEDVLIYMFTMYIFILTTILHRYIEDIDTTTFVYTICPVADLGQMRPCAS